MKKILTSIALSLGLGLIIATVIIGVKFSLHGKLPTGTVVANINMSYQTVEEAKDLLNEKIRKFSQTPIKMVLVRADGTGELRTEFLPEELGIEYQPEETIKTIQRINLKKNNLAYELQRTSTPMEALYSLDAEKLMKALNDRFFLEELSPKNATYFVNENSKLDIMEEAEGEVMDYEFLIREIKDMAGKIESKNLFLQTKKAKPVLFKEDLEGMKDEVVEKLKTKITIKYGKQKWIFEPMRRLDWLEFTETNELKLPYFNDPIEMESKYLRGVKIGEEGSKKKIKILINEDKLNEYIDAEMASKIEVEADPVSIYKDEEGEIKIEGTGRNGIGIQRGMLKKSLELATENFITEVEVFTKTTVASIDIDEEIRALGIKELVATGHTNFEGSPANRVHNIKVGMERFNGTLIEPGQEFAFNQTLGRVDATTGYKEELVIKSIGTIPEYGGGLCQVSTTMYRAAIFAGLPITARAPHSYAVSYYSRVLGHGLDATIYIGGQDLKFTNDTGAHILIGAYVDGKNAYIKFYGTADGREVSLDGPHLSNYRYPSSEIIYETSEALAPGEKKQIERKNTGFNALWYRTVRFGDGTELVEEIISRYKATQEKYLVGPSR